MMPHLLHPKGTPKGAHLLHPKGTPKNAPQGARAGRPQRPVAGFTLIETMMSLLILVLLAGIVASGIPVASRSYTKTVDAANAQAALTTTAAKLRDELGLAQDIFFNKDDGTVAFFKVSDGYWAAIENPQAEGEKGLYIQSYVGMPDATQSAMPYGMEKGERVPLVPDAAIVGDMRVVYGATDTTGATGATGAADGTPMLEYNAESGVFVVSGLRVIDADDASRVLAATGEKTNGELKIRSALY